MFQGIGRTAGRPPALSAGAKTVANCRYRTEYLRGLGGARPSAKINRSRGTELRTANGCQAEPFWLNGTIQARKPDAPAGSFRGIPIMPPGGLCGKGYSAPLALRICAILMSTTLTWVTSQSPTSFLRRLINSSLGPLAFSSSVKSRTACLNPS